MFLGSYQNSIMLAGQDHFGQLEKSHLIHHFHQDKRFVLPTLENNFQDVFLTNFAPNTSNISICSQSDRSYETYSFSNECYGQSVDHFMDDINGYNHVLEEQSGTKIQVNNQNNIGQKSIVLADLQANIQEDKFQTSHDQTKNIPKNYIKAIFSFILKNQDYLMRLFSNLRNEDKAGEVVRFIEFVKQQKMVKKYTIQRLKSLWLNVTYGKAMRIISSEFMRKHSLGYILGSKIEKKMAHIKHRYKLMNSIENPSDFTNIK